MNHSAYLFPLFAVAILLLIVARLVNNTHTSGNDKPAQEEGRQSMYSKSNDHPLVVCAQVDTRRIGLRQGKCEICIDHGFKVDECEIVMPDSIYQFRAKPVADSLQREYEKIARRW